MRRARPKDRPALIAHLRAHEAESMFPLVNLMGQGVAMRVWVAGWGGVTGMVGLTETGMVLPQWPGGRWNKVAEALRGQRVEGLLGPADQVHGLRAALGLQDAPVRHAANEPGFALTLDALRLPDVTDCRLAPLGDASDDLVTSWRAAYQVELFGMAADEAQEVAAQDVVRWREADSHRVLWHAGQPVALTGINARLRDVVQVGGVYVPPAFRGRAHARRAVGLHLAEERALNGVQRAVLFAASAAAARAYAALGFQRAGDMGLVLFTAPQEVMP